MKHHLSGLTVAMTLIMLIGFNAVPAQSRYLKAYEQVLQLVKKRHDAISICQITGRTMNTNRQYLRLVKDFHPDLKPKIPDKTPSTKR